MQKKDIFEVKTNNIFTYGQFGNQGAFIIYMKADKSVLHIQIF